MTMVMGDNHGNNGEQQQWGTMTMTAPPTSSAGGIFFFCIFIIISLPTYMLTHRPLPVRGFIEYIMYII
jgi:hypothetical protein